MCVFLCTAQCYHCVCHALPYTAGYAVPTHGGFSTAALRMLTPMHCLHIRNMQVCLHLLPGGRWVMLMMPAGLSTCTSGPASACSFASRLPVWADSSAALPDSTMPSASCVCSACKSQPQLLLLLEALTVKQHVIVHMQCSLRVVCREDLAVASCAQHTGKKGVCVWQLL